MEFEAVRVIKCIETLYVLIIKSVDTINNVYIYI